MSYYRIVGGQPLSGEITTASGKNAPIAILFACLMVKGQVTLSNVSAVEEVFRVVELLESLGVTVTWQDTSTLSVDARQAIDIDNVDKAACKRTRIALLLFGALAAQKSSFKVYRSGGCKLGSRSTRGHSLALKKLGVHVSSKRDHYLVERTNLKGAKVVMYESGDTATENVIMAAVLAKGTTTIKFASSNYMVQELCYFLVKAGAKISGIGTTTLVITGVKALKKKLSYELLPDPVDAMAWISLGVTTKSALTIKNCPLDFLELELEKLAEMGQKFTLKRERKATEGDFTLVDIVLEPSSLVALPDKLYGRPFPGLNIDALPLFIPIVTQAKGTSLIHDWVYENRALYALELQKVGASVMLMDPHRLLIEGPRKLVANEVVCPPAIRPAMSILIAMIAAKGTSILRNVYPIERAYGDVLPRLQALGVDITREQE